MRKKYIAFLMLLVMVIVPPLLSGCGGGSHKNVSSERSADSGKPPKDNKRASSSDPSSQSLRELPIGDMEEFIAVFQQNPALAKQQYTGLWTRVTYGIVWEIADDGSKIVVSPGERVRGFLCTAKNEMVRNKIINTLQKRNSIIDIYGKITAVTQGKQYAYAFDLYDFDDVMAPDYKFPEQSRQNKTESDSPKNNTSQNKPQSSSSSSQSVPSGTIQSADFALSGFSIGDTKDKAASIFGSPNKETKKGDILQCYYNNIEIHYKNNRAINMFTNGNALKTSRGVSEGTPVSSILSAYGQGYSLESFEGLNLYEYEGTSTNGTASILRFAVRQSDNLVDYIGVRKAD